MQVFREDFLQQKIPTNFLVLAQKAPILCSKKLPLRKTKNNS